MKNILIALITFTCFAQDAHEHGKINLDIAFEGKSGIVMLHGSAEAFLGFEHKAKTKKEKKVLNTLKESTTNIENLITFENKLKCKSQRTSFGFNHEEHDDHDHKDKKEHKGHQNFKVSYKVECSKAVEKTKISFDFSKALKSIHEVELQFINNSYQAGKEIESSKGSFDVK